MSRTQTITATLLLLVLACSVYTHFMIGNAEVKNWLLLAARMLLQGKKFSFDIFKVDPPFIF